MPASYSLGAVATSITFDEDAHRASFALLDAGRTPNDALAPGLLAGI